jgi:hypothetical protein
MYKLSPYEIVTRGTGVNVLTNAAAASIASNGFDVVRLTSNSRLPRSSR